PYKSFKSISDLIIISSRYSTSLAVSCSPVAPAGACPDTLVPPVGPICCSVGPGVGGGLIMGEIGRMGWIGCTGWMMGEIGRMGWIGCTGWIGVIERQRTFATRTALCASTRPSPVATSGPTAAAALPVAGLQLPVGTSSAIFLRL